jgi:hypothetical protein
MIPAPEMVERLTRMARAKHTWLSDFSSGRNARPRHEIERQTENLEALEQASLAYAAKAKKEQTA